MPTFDPYGMTDKLDDGGISAMAARLEARGNDPQFRAMLDDYLDALDPPSLKRVLEVGCGTGIAARTLASRPDFAGHIDASDLGPGLVDMARTLAEAEGCADRISFSVGNALQVKPEQPYDAVIAHTVISHVPDYRRFLAGLAGAAGRDGKVVLFDGDYASTVFAAEREEDGVALANAVIHGIVTNPSIMRQMPRLAAELGMDVTHCRAHILSEVGAAGFFTSLFNSLRVLVPKSGLADQAAIDGWIDQQIAYSRTGTFFGSMTYYSYILRPRG